MTEEAQTRVAAWEMMQSGHVPNVSQRLSFLNTVARVSVLGRGVKWSGEGKQKPDWLISRERRRL